MSFFTNQLRNEITKILESFLSCSLISRKQSDEHWQQLNKLQALSQVQIDTIDYKGQQNTLDESVTLSNRGSLAINIGEWRIQAGSPSQVYIFPKNTYLPAYEALRVDTSGKTEHSFNSNRPIWNNRGDMGTLLDEEGQVISTLAYGSDLNHKVIISHILFDGEEYRSEGDEYVEISNVSNDDVMLDGCRIEAETNNKSFVFPAQAKLAAYSSLRVFTNKADLQDNEYSFNSPTAIWNNASGGCRLLDNLDREMSVYHY